MNRYADGWRMTKKSREDEERNIKLARRELNGLARSLVRFSS